MLSLLLNRLVPSHVPNPTSAAREIAAMILRHMVRRGGGLGRLDSSYFTSRYCVTVILNNTRTLPRLVEMSISRTTRSTFPHYGQPSKICKKHSGVPTGGL